jgi:hypothetical protein
MSRYVTLQLRDDTGRVKAWAIVELPDEVPADKHEPSAPRKSRSFETKREALASLREMLGVDDA